MITEFFTSGALRCARCGPPAVPACWPGCPVAAHSLPHRAGQLPRPPELLLAPARTGCCAGPQAWQPRRWLCM